MIKTHVLAAKSKQSQDIVIKGFGEGTKKNMETPVWWLDDMIKFIGVLLGAAMIVYQLGRQHKNQLELQKESFREKLRLKVYQEFSPVLQEANYKTGDAGMYAFLLLTNMKIHLDRVTDGSNPPPVRERAPEFSEKHHDASGAIVNLILLLEKYEVVSPELNIFRTAFIVANHNMRGAFGPLYSFLVQFLPVDLPTPAGSIQVVNLLRLTAAQLQQLEDLVTAYKAAQEEMGGYLYDINVELQNIFLSKLFNNKVPKRQPIDPNVRVVSTDPKEVEILLKYFEKETEWGHRKLEIEQDLRKQFNKP